MVETPKLVLEAFESGLVVESVIVPSNVHPDPDIAEACDRTEAKLFSLDAGAYAKLADAKTPQPALAVVEAPSLEVNDRFPVDVAALFLVLVDVSDPGNVGTLIRTAEASGCAGVIVTSETSDVLSPKVVRSSAGSMLRVPIGEADRADLDDVLAKLDVKSIATAMDGTPFNQLDSVAGERVAILLGSEAHGLGDELLSSADLRVSIPMHGRVESLNVATTGAVLAFAFSQPSQL